MDTETKVIYMFIIQDLARRNNSTRFDGLTPGHINEEVVAVVDKMLFNLTQCTKNMLTIKSIFEAAYSVSLASSFKSVVMKVGSAVIGRWYAGMQANRVSKACLLGAFVGYQHAIFEAIYL